MIKCEWRTNLVLETEPEIIKLMLIDDDEDDYLILKGYLMDINGQARYSLDWVQSYQAGLDQILLGEHHLYLVDHVLGDGSGLNLLKEAIQAGCQKPILIVTGLEDRDVDQAAMQAGATDYLVKGQFSAQLLERSIRYALERNRLLNKIREMAARDPLTGLFNLRELKGFLEYTHIRSQRYNHPFSLLLLDIDHFKSINDQFGHRAGNEILQHVAQVLESNTRECDLAVRYGGDEFIVVLTETPGNQACHVAERLRQTIESLTMHIKDKKGDSDQFIVTVSIGFAEFPSDTSNGEALIDLADQALYHAKRQGCNRVVHYQTVKDKPTGL